MSLSGSSASVDVVAGGGCFLADLEDLPFFATDGGCTTSSGLNGTSSVSSKSEESVGNAAGRSNLGRPSSSCSFEEKEEEVGKAALAAAAAASSASGVEYGSDPSGGGAFSSPAREYDTDRSL